MKIKEDIRPVSYVKAHTADVLNQVNKTHRPMYVTQNGEAKAVVLDSDTYENMKNALGLLKLISQGEEDIKNGKIVSQDEVFSSIENKLKSMSADE
jgi:prevent-host-death family protein